MHKAFQSLVALSALGLTNVAVAARNQKQDCAPEKAVPCYQDDCCRTYCLGPSNYGVNAPVKPVTCNGDFGIEIAGFYWNAHQDGMEYAIDNHVANPRVQNGGSPPDSTADTQVLNRLIDAEYKTPDFNWEFGFKAGVYYNSPCDGWDIGILWTWYKGKASTHIEAEDDDNHSLLPLWSAWSPGVGGVLWATDIETKWDLKLNLVDIELGRQFWTSRYLSIRPHIGLRIAFIDQDFDIQHKGGAWSENDSQSNTQPAFNNYVDLDNNYKGVGVRAGLDSEWNFGCGWAIYGNLAASIVYGKFSLNHDEWNREAAFPHDKTKLLETKEHFRASRAMLDLALGLQWSTLFCDCNYGFTIQLGWEQHLFFHQNQMWRVVRIGDGNPDLGAVPNNTGENVFHQRRGNLDTQGVTLTVKFEF